MEKATTAGSFCHRKIDFVGFPPCNSDTLYHTSLLDKALLLLGIGVGMCTELLSQHCFNAQFCRSIAIVFAVMIIIMLSCFQLG